MRLCFCASGRQIRQSLGPFPDGRKAQVLVIQVYTGKGKGKTTAALGLALRAAGAGLKVYIGQFAKSGIYNELMALKKIKNIKMIL